MALYATHAMQCYYRTDLSDASDFLTELRAAALASSHNVEARAKTQPEMSKMATTLTMGLVVWPKLYILQVGDSRAYAFGEGSLRRLTRDQTMAQDLVDRGALKPSDAERSPLRNILSSAIGRDPTPDVTQHSLYRGELLLLCSDGLSSYVSEERLAARCRQHAAAEPLCRALMEDALEAGGSDNITVLAARSLPES
jgi:protein phosphatase